ncbi:MAG TPA: alpha/beta hydrolase [Bryobacteraceae bacterium]|nr:alpha/beta hydrolase [Bryobacteraceae bacterium]
MTRTVQVGNLPVTYAVTGQGSPLVLIHGLAASSRWWQSNVPVLSKHYTVYLVDLPGYGCMRKYGREFCLEGAPEWTRRLLQALGLERPSIIGHSMGGAIALAFAAQWPGEVDRLVLAAAAVDLPHKNVRSNILPLLAASGAVQPSFYPTLLWDAARAGPATLLRSARQLVTMNIPPGTPDVQSPTLLVWGRNDGLVPGLVGQRLRTAMPTSRLHVIDRAGHVVMFDRAAEFNDAVLRFLSGEDVGI